MGQASRPAARERSEAALSFVVAGAAVALVAPGPRRRCVQLPPGVVELHTEMVRRDGTEVRGAAPGPCCARRRISRARAHRGARASTSCCAISPSTATAGAGSAPGLPGYDVPFARFTAGNGVLAQGVYGLTIGACPLPEIAGFAVLVSRSRQVAIDPRATSRQRVAQRRRAATTPPAASCWKKAPPISASRAASSRNIRGNGIWTHSLYTSPRNARGVFAENRFRQIGRDAIQVGHATDVRVEGNTGTRIGFPVEDVDIEGRAIPVAIDTAGNVDRSTYARNQFNEVNGKCIDLDGFHDGEVRGTPA